MSCARVPLGSLVCVNTSRKMEDGEACLLDFSQPYQHRLGLAGAGAAERFIAPAAHPSVEAAAGSPNLTSPLKNRIIIPSHA